LVVKEGQTPAGHDCPLLGRFPNPIFLERSRTVDGFETSQGFVRPVGFVISRDERTQEARKEDVMNILSRLLLLAPVLATACGGSPTTASTTQTSTQPPAQTPPSSQPAPVLAMFRDPSSSFSTSDVRDAQDDIVQFDTASGSLIWAADGRRFAGYPVMDSYFVRSDKNFQVRFGTKNGERRAYFTETATGTICDVNVIAGQLSITPTAVTVPGS
jgi:hypothetical protein